MTTCWACDTTVRPEWKFCIQCGVPVEKDADTALQARDALPSSPLAMFGWIFAGIGAALIVAGVVLFLLVK